MSQDPQIKYAVIVRSKRVQSKGETFTKRGDKFWVTDGEWGRTTSRLNRHQSDEKQIPPREVSTWPTPEAAHAAMTGWEGHPWWCSVLDYKIVRLIPKMKTVFSHYEQVPQD